MYQSDLVLNALNKFTEVNSLSLWSRASFFSIKLVITKFTDYWEVSVGNALDKKDQILT